MKNLKIPLCITFFNVLNNLYYQKEPRNAIPALRTTTSRVPVTPAWTANSSVKNSSVKEENVGGLIQFRMFQFLLTPLSSFFVQLLSSSARVPTRTWTAWPVLQSASSAREREAAPAATKTTAINDRTFIKLKSPCPFDLLRTSLPSCTSMKIRVWSYRLLKDFTTTHRWILYFLKAFFRKRILYSRNLRNRDKNVNIVIQENFIWKKRASRLSKRTLRLFWQVRQRWLRLVLGSNDPKNTRR